MARISGSLEEARNPVYPFDFNIIICDKAGDCAPCLRGRTHPTSASSSTVTCTVSVKEDKPMKKAQKKTRLQTMKQQFTVFVLVSFILAVGLTCWRAYDFWHTQHDSLDNYLNLYARQLKYTTTQTYQSFENIAYSVAYNTLVQDYIPMTDTDGRYEAYQRVYNLLNNTANLNSSIVDITIIGAEGNSVSLSASPGTYIKLMEQSEPQTDAFVSLGTLTVNDIACHILAMPVHRLTISGQNQFLGTVLLAISTGRFFAVDLQDGRSDSPSILFTDASGFLIYGDPGLMEALVSFPDDTKEDIRLLGQRFLVQSFSLPEIRSRLYVLFDISPYLDSVFRITLREALFLLFGIACLSLLYLTYWLRISGALRHLTGFMQHITAGERKTMHKIASLKDSEYGCTEIRDIYTAYNEMMNEITSLNTTIFNTYTKMYELEMNNRQTEIAFLRSQINPHFLYNSIATICGMAADGKTEEIADVTSSLSTIFRYSVRGKDMVTVEEEISIVRSYLMIQTYRFEDRFSVSLDVKEDTLSFMIPKMIIQPLVENAIVHGLEPLLHRGKLIISVHFDETGKHLVISVMDTGVGMPAARLTELRNVLKASVVNKSADAAANLKSFDAAHHESIGLFNVNSRIALYYGGEYGLHLDSWENAGTRIEIRIPDKGK